MDALPKLYFYKCYINVSVISSTKHADSIDLELEVDPLNVDHFSCTPLVRNSDLNNTVALCKYSTEMGNSKLCWSRRIRSVLM